MTELFDDLLPFYWRDVEVPISRLEVEIAHDLVPHKPWGVNGARVEATGLAPVRFIATIPFINTLAPGKNEGWLSGELYPVVFRDFVIAFQDRRTGQLQHPEFGKVACKPDKLTFALAGETRNGVIVTASFVETLDDDVRTDIRNPLIELDAAAVDFDGQRTDLLKIVPQLPEYKETFADLARKVAAVGDQVALLQYRAAGRINSILYQVDRVQRSIDRARSALTWPATQKAERVKASTIELRAKLLQANRDVLLYVVPEDTTMAGLIPKLAGAKLADLIKLNPRLMSSPIVPSKTVVRYFKAA